MKRIIAAILFVFSAFASLQAQTAAEFDRSKYVAEIRQERANKDKEMVADEHSPIPELQKADFKKLNYYKPKVSYRKKAAFERFEQATRFFMKTTTDRLPEYSLFGQVTFDQNGKKCTLNVYQNIELVKKPGYGNQLFIPFNDLTNGKETYSGGRFLDIADTGTDYLIIDFNKAYNPYCAYNHKYSCPIPPEGNSLKIKIKAGEKKWHNNKSENNKRF